MSFAGFVRALRRCKRLNDDVNTTPLARCLNLFDLTALGVGSTLGLGVYVLAGSVAKTVAGPAVVISFTIAAIASAFAGLCYAEFAARVPKAGSAYVYSYVSVGEFIAFTIGWNLILEYVISTASMAKGTSNYIDTLFNHTMSSTMTRVAPIHVPFMAKYPDFFAFFLVIVATVILASGAKESTRLNNVLTAINMFTVVTVICAGSIKSDPANWRIKVDEIPSKYQSKAGEGGFMPWGLSGIMTGSAKCFFGFVGFDCLATTGEEAKRPTRDIPIAIVLSLVIIFLSYFGMATVLTMMWPYYLQDEAAPLPYAFEQTGMHAIKWIVTVGAITALCTNLIGAFFPLPRVLYAMSVDGLMCKDLARINGKTKTPVVATVSSGLLAAILSTVFDLEQLIEMLSIGTLLAYTLVATSVLVLRYETKSSWPPPPPQPSGKPPATSSCEVMLQTLNCRRVKEPTELTASVAKITVILVLFVSLALSTVATYLYSVPAVGLLGAFMGLLLLVLYRQPRHQVKDITFAVPLVPLVPYLSVLINVYLMVQLDVETWIRFIVWMLLGYLIYFAYGIRNSSLNRRPSVRISSTINVKDQNGSVLDKDAAIGKQHSKSEIAKRHRSPTIEKRENSISKL